MGHFFAGLIQLLTVCTLLYCPKVSPLRIPNTNTLILLELTELYLPMRQKCRSMNNFSILLLPSRGTDAYGPLSQAF